MTTPVSFDINLRSLSVGRHHYEYLLDTEWFEGIEGAEVKDGEVSVQVEVNHTGYVYEFLFRLNGRISLPCDRCLETMSLPIDLENRLLVKLGPEYNDEDDSLLIVSEGEGSLNIAWLLYEMIALSVPLKHVHPEGECQPEMSSKLHEHLANCDSEHDNDWEADEPTGSKMSTNPIWDELKKLKQ